LLLNLRDVRDFFGMARWFFGLGAKPGFERWTYWEKMDYWAVFLAALGIGSTGLALWLPNVFCSVFPGAALNVAKLIHSEIALYAASILFLIHFFNTHFRPEKFPMDLSVLTGLVSEEHVRGQRPEYVERLEREGELERMRRPAPPKEHLRRTLFAGILVFSVGLGLLASLLFVSLGE
jgi:cytochrome b subunit of formate dehydrogenase